MSLRTSDQQNKNEYKHAGKQRPTYTLEDTTQWECPLCGSHQEKQLKTERGVLGVVRCEECSLIRINPRLKAPETIYHGTVEAYREEYRWVIEGKAAHHRDENYKRDVEILEKVKPTGNFLDIGCHTGSFLRHARGKGWKLLGLEPSPSLAQLARDWWGLEVVEGFIESAPLPENHFDIVTMTDVFEHIINPKEVLHAVKRVLKPDGIIFIKVPNGDFNVVKFRMRKLLRKTNADDFDSYEHVVHYNESTLTQMLEASGFEVDMMTIEPPVQIPAWHRVVGQYYQHKSPWILDWKTHTARSLLYYASHLERVSTRRIGWLAPNIGCIARPKYSK